MTKVSEMFPSKWLSASEIASNVYRVTISAYGIEEFDNGNKMSLNFQGAQKGIILNHTNRNTMVWLYGDDADVWIGKEVEIFTEPVTYKGKVSLGIKVRGVAAPQPVQALPAVQPLPAPTQPQGPQAPLGPGEEAMQRTALPQNGGQTDDELSDSIPF